MIKKNCSDPQFSTITFGSHYNFRFIFLHFFSFFLADLLKAEPTWIWIVYKLPSLGLSTNVLSGLLAGPLKDIKKHVPVMLKGKCSSQFYVVCTREQVFFKERNF